MYFRNRVQAGDRLVVELPERYYKEQTSVLALSQGGVIVGAEIARALKCNLNLLMTAPVALPGLSNAAVIGLIDQDGHFTYNSMLPTGMLMELVEEMRNYIEAEKLNQMQQMTHTLGAQGVIDRKIFKKRHVVIVSDGFKSGLPFEAAVNYLKSIATGRLVAAAPNVSVTAVDKLHLMADEIHVLDVLDNYLDTNHYFDDNELPDTKLLLESLKEHEG